jgi:hypothetical protein
MEDNSNMEEHNSHIGNNIAKSKTQEQEKIKRKIYFY